MPNSVWTIHANGLDPNSGQNRVYLIGCHITTNSADPPTAYEFTLPNITEVLSTTTGYTLPTGEFDFPEFGLWDGNMWNIHVKTLNDPGGQAEGKWHTTSTDGTDEDGNWTAQAGTGAGDDKPEDDADTDYDEPESATSTAA